MTITKTILASTLTLSLAVALAPASGAGANSQAAPSGSKPSPAVQIPDQKAAPKAQGLSDKPLPAIPATTITFGVMANAHRIASRIPD